MAKRIKILYIAGMGRSGSTLLTNLLGQIPGIIGVGELYEIWERGLIHHQLCGCSRAFPDCPFWNQVLANAFPRDTLPDPAEMMQIAAQMRRIRRFVTLRSNANYRHRVQLYMENIIKLYRAIDYVSGTNVIVEESKVPTYAFELIEAKELEIYILHLVRDSRAVAYSWTRKRRRPEYPDDNPWMFRHSVARSTYLWIMWNTLSEYLGSHMSGRYLRMRYEDMVGDPVTTIQAVLEFLKIPFPDLGLEEILVSNKTVHTVWGNPMRFERPISIRPDFEWKAAMPLKSRLFVGSLTWPFLCRYGYLSR